MAASKIRWYLSLGLVGEGIFDLLYQINSMDEYSFIYQAESSYVKKNKFSSNALLYLLILNS